MPNDPELAEALAMGEFYKAAHERSEVLIAKLYRMAFEAYRPETVARMPELMWRAIDAHTRARVTAERERAEQALAAQAEQREAEMAMLAVIDEHNAGCFGRPSIADLRGTPTGGRA